MRSPFVAIILAFSLLVQWTGIGVAANWVWCFEEDGHVHLEEAHKGVEPSFGLTSQVLSIEGDEHHLEGNTSECLDVPLALIITTPKTSKSEHELSANVENLAAFQLRFRQEFLITGLLAEPPPYLVSNQAITSLRTVILII